MLSDLFEKYCRVVLDRPVWTLIGVALIVALLGIGVKDFRLDASSDTLVLENDRSLDFYRTVRARYGSDDVLILTYTPKKNELFSNSVLDDIESLQNSLNEIEAVNGVTSLLTVPLVHSPRVGLKRLSHDPPTLRDPVTDRAQAKNELTSSPLYEDLVISSDGKTAALLIEFKRDERWHALMSRRNRLRKKAAEGTLPANQYDALAAAEAEFRRYKSQAYERMRSDTAQVREIMEKHRPVAEMFLGGVPMITVDSMEFIRSDLRTFGVGVLLFVIALLTVLFRRPRWVILPMLTCGAVAVSLTGLLGWVHWPVTVVSSNFISLLLIFTLSFTVHQIVRYRELHDNARDQDLRARTKEMVRTIGTPCFYMAITTMVAFSSLVISDIRPVIDFGWMMTTGLAVAFILSFLILPASIMLLPEHDAPDRHEIAGALMHTLADLVKKYRWQITVLFVGIAAISIAGMQRLSVENRFIDYFKSDTAIHQGMKQIDQELGGTTPLDIIIDKPHGVASDQAMTSYSYDYSYDQASAESNKEKLPKIAQGYWFNGFMLDDVAKAHDYIESLEETGKVLSLHTAIEMLHLINPDEDIDTFYLSLVYKKMPPAVRDILFTPYISDDGDQLRISVRVYETEGDLNRQNLLKKIETELPENANLEPSQVRMTGMLVLYNNVLQSLFDSQIKTLGFVFLAIFIMFIILFRNWKMAAVAIVPNTVIPLAILGTMGAFSIPLDIMTITIAAICTGVAADDTIHYVHRFTTEFDKDGDYRAAVTRAHDGIGRAMLYTTLVITLGFSILMLSNFVPTIYFGLLTGISMMVALISDLTFLSALILLFKPLGPQRAQTS